MKTCDESIEKLRDLVNVQLKRFQTTIKHYQHQKSTGNPDLSNMQSVLSPRVLNLRSVVTFNSGVSAGFHEYVAPSRFSICTTCLSISSAAPSA